MRLPTDNKKRGTHDQELLGKMYDILIESVGAPGEPYDRFCFIKAALNWDYRFPFEYRFCGSLGFGGKIWLPLDEAPYVNCYREDESAARLAMVKVANSKLSKLVKP